MAQRSLGRKKAYIMIICTNAMKVKKNSPTKYYMKVVDNYVVTPGGEK